MTSKMLVLSHTYVSNEKQSANNETVHSKKKWILHVFTKKGDFLKSNLHVFLQKGVKSKENTMEMR